MPGYYREYALGNFDRIFIDTQHPQRQPLEGGTKDTGGLYEADKTGTTGIVPLNSRCRVIKVKRTNLIRHIRLTLYLQRKESETEYQEPYQTSVTRRSLETRPEKWLNIFI